jgi:hypothetical protein
MTNPGSWLLLRIICGKTLGDLGGSTFRVFSWPVSAPSVSSVAKSAHEKRSY